MRDQAVYKPCQGSFSASALAAEQDAFTFRNVQGNIVKTLLAGFSVVKTDIFYLYNEGTPPITENTTSAVNSADTR
jgi:hypothetical protein